MGVAVASDDSGTPLSESAANLVVQCCIVGKSPEVIHSAAGGALNTTDVFGSASYQFTYTMPAGATAGSVHTLYAVARLGLSGSWKHAANFVVTTLAPPTPPTLNKTFGAASINVGQSTSLGFTVTNPNAGTTLTNISFVDNLPTGLVVATPNGLVNTCGGGFSGAAGSTSVSISGVSLAPSTSCTLSVNITGTTAGIKNNTTNPISSTEGGAGGTASASIDVVNPAGPPS